QFPPLELVGCTRFAQRDTLPRLSSQNGEAPLPAALQPCSCIAVYTSAKEKEPLRYVKRVVMVGPLMTGMLGGALAQIVLLGSEGRPMPASLPTEIGRASCR